MIIQLIVEQKDGLHPLEFNCRQLINAGFTGRNQEEIGRHIEELKKIGVPTPESIPTLYPIPRHMLTLHPSIEVCDHETSGEVEYVLLIQDLDDIFVGLGSDHTDRLLEKSDIARSKQIYPNLLSTYVWSMEDIYDHWDNLVLRSYIHQGRKKILYQESSLEAIFDPYSLISFIQEKFSTLVEGTIVYSGTVSSLTSDFIYGERFQAELVDNVLGRQLNLDYAVTSLSATLD